MKELSTFCSSIADEGINVLLQTVNTLFHLLVEALGSHEALYKIFVSIERPSVLAQDTVSALLYGIILLLVGSDSLVLQEIAIGLCQFLEQGRLLVHGGDEAVLV